MTSRRAPALQIAPPSDGDEPVVDLRAGRSALAPSLGGPVPTPPPARRATDPPPVAIDAASPVPSTAADGDLDGPDASEGDTTRSGSLADRALLAVVPALVALVVGAVIATAAMLAARSAGDDVTSLQARLGAELGASTQIEQLHAAVLGTVAAGVGQPVVAPDAIPVAIGELRGVVGANASAPQSAEGVASRDATTEFVDAVEQSLEVTGGDPLELGNELESLAALGATARERSAASIDEVRGRLDDAGSTEDRWLLAGTVAALLSLLAGGVLVVAARRRLRNDLDRPVEQLTAAIERIGAGERGAGSTVAGPSELAAIGVGMDRAAARLSSRLSTLERRAEWGERSRMIFEALDLADDEAAAHEVIGEALAIVDATHPSQLLLAERGSSRLASVAANVGSGSPGCPVETTSACVALRRGQVAVFDSSESINACPKLRDRPGGPCSAVCVPVTVAARQVGVLHATGPDGVPAAHEVVEQLVSLSTSAGNRLSALRTLESSRQEASTDGLTGLPNRRTLESEVAELIERSTPFVMVLADLDKFKKLNDNFGHEVGDKALQLFAGVLRDNVRGNDVVARLGGEEFVLVYPNMSVEISIEAIDRLRLALARTVGASTIPPFTCSFGIAHSSVGGDGDAVLRVADAGLLQAKELGGDQAVFADEALAAQVFADDATTRPSVADDRDR